MVAPRRPAAPGRRDGLQAGQLALAASPAPGPALGPGWPAQSRLTADCRPRCPAWCVPGLDLRSCGYRSPRASQAPRDLAKPAAVLPSGPQAAQPRFSLPPAVAGGGRSRVLFFAPGRGLSHGSTPPPDAPAVDSATSLGPSWALLQPGAAARVACRAASNRGPVTARRRHLARGTRSRTAALPSTVRWCRRGCRWSICSLIGAALRTHLRPAVARTRIRHLQRPPASAPCVGSEAAWFRPLRTCYWHARATPPREVTMPHPAAVGIAHAAWCPASLSRLHLSPRAIGRCRCCGAAPQPVTEAKERAVGSHAARLPRGRWSPPPGGWPPAAVVLVESTTTSSREPRRGGSSRLPPMARGDKARSPAAPVHC